TGPHIKAAPPPQTASAPRCIVVTTSYTQPLPDKLGHRAPPWHGWSLLALLMRISSTRSHSPVHKLFVDVPPRFPKPREKQFLATVIVSRLAKPAGEEKPGPGRLSSRPWEEARLATQHPSILGRTRCTPISGQHQDCGSSSKSSEPCWAPDDELPTRTRQPSGLCQPKHLLLTIAQPQ
ncbi:hypothetical protein E2I00_009085, partial [Balaenoptera physalus]